MRKMTNNEIITQFEQLVRSERKLTAQIVEYIKEIDSRRIFLELGFNSTFAYLTDGMGYTAAEAQRRIDSARLLRELPNLGQEIQAGALNLTQLSIVAQAVRAKEKQAGVRIDTATKFEICADLKNQNTQATQQKVAELLDIPIESHERKKVQQDGSVRLDLTLSEEQMAKLARAREVLSSTLQEATMAELIVRLAEEFLSRKDPLVVEERVQAREAKSQAKKVAGITSVAEVTADKSTQDQLASNGNLAQRAQGAQGEQREELQVQAEERERGEHGERTEQQAQQEQPAQPAQRRDQHKLTPRIRRFVLFRDRCCQWKNSASGEICGSTFDLEVDHIRALWAGGDDDVLNLQALCRVHNLQKYRAEAGIRSV